MSGAEPKWHDASVAHPCPLCKRPDWCRVSEDGDWCCCRRESAGAVKEKQDASGGTFYLHRLTPWPENPNEWPEPTCSLESGGGRRADPDTLNRVYGELLKHLPLSPQHAAELGRRGIREDALAAGYRTLGKGRGHAVQQVIKAGLEKHLPTAPGFFVQIGKRKKYWTIGGWSGILVPVRDEQGRIIRLLVRKDGDAPEGKYQWLSSKKRGGAKSGAPAHVPLFSGDKSTVRITEGALKSDIATRLSSTLTIGLSSVGTWKPASRVLLRLGAKTALVAYDADSRRNRHVAGHLRRLVRQLREDGFAVELETWDEADGKGIDDLLAAGKQPAVVTGDAVDAAVEGVVGEAEAADSAPEGEGAPEGESVPQGNTYRAVAGILCLCKWEDGKEEHIPLCNFTARIAEERVRDDGAETFVYFAVDGRTAGGVELPAVEVAASEFNDMSWVMDRWGAAAIIEAGRGVKDHLRAAIQWQSLGRAPRRTLYAHLGWRKFGPDWLFLHGAGAIGTDGFCGVIETAPPEPLARFVLPAPPGDDELRAAVRASLGLLDGFAPDRISFPLAAAPYRAVLGEADFSVHFVGATQRFKTEAAALAQQHFGSDLDARHLPGSWSSTGNSLEALCFAAKDALVVVDDFSPGGSTSDVQRSHREADRVLRAQGNKSGRGRLRPDGTLRPAKPPRGLILSTGEDAMRGPSLQSRVFAVEFLFSDVNKDRLTECQADAAKGLYAASMSGFLRWLAPRYGEVLAGLRQERAAIRARAAKECQYARTPDIVANLALGLRYFLDFAAHVGAVTGEEGKALKRRGWAALMEGAAGQAAHIAAAEPGGQFVRLLAAAVASGRAHLASATGGAPCPAEAWGWRSLEREGGEVGAALPQGRRIGWLEDGHIHLDADSSFAEAQRLAAEQGESLPVGQRTLWKRLHERGLILTDGRGGKTRFTWRRVLEGQQRDVLLMRQDALFRTADDGAPADTPARESAGLDTPEVSNGHEESGACPPGKNGAAKGYGGSGHSGHLYTNNKEKSIHARHVSDTNESPSRCNGV